MMSYRLRREPLLPLNSPQSAIAPICHIPSQVSPVTHPRRANGPPQQTLRPWSAVPRPCRAPSVTFLQLTRPFLAKGATREFRPQRATPFRKEPATRGKRCSQYSSKFRWLPGKWMFVNISKYPGHLSSERMFHCFAFRSVCQIQH